MVVRQNITSSCVLEITKVFIENKGVQHTFAMTLEQIAWCPSSNMRIRHFVQPC